MTRDQIVSNLEKYGHGQSEGCSMLKVHTDTFREAYLYITALEYALTHNEEGIPYEDWNQLIHEEQQSQLAVSVLREREKLPGDHQNEGPCCGYGCCD